MLPLVLSRLGGLVQDAVAPAFCVQCNAAGGWLCEICAEQIFFVKAQVCYRCGKLSEQGKTCQRCRRYTHLGGVLVATHYESGPVRELVHRLKYEALTDLAKILSWILLQAVEGKAWDGWTAVPVPLHPKRLAGRGFNQADLLGRRLAGYLQMPCRSRWLRRIRATEAQVELSGMHRRINVYKAFLAKQDLRGMKILLVDDVMTTGATLEDAARALKDAGAKMVWAAVVARGS